MLEIRTSRIPKHKGIIFLLDTEADLFIGKIYDVPDKEIIAERWVKGYNEMRNNLGPIDIIDKEQDEPLNTDGDNNEFWRSLTEDEIREIT